MLFKDRRSWWCAKEGEGKREKLNCSTVVKGMTISHRATCSSNNSARQNTTSSQYEPADDPSGDDEIEEGYLRGIEERLWWHLHRNIIRQHRTQMENP